MSLIITLSLEEARTVAKIEQILLDVLTATKDMKGLIATILEALRLLSEKRDLPGRANFKVKLEHLLGGINWVQCFELKELDDDNQRESRRTEISHKYLEDSLSENNKSNGFFQPGKYYRPPADTSTTSTA